VFLVGGIAPCLLLPFLLALLPESIRYLVVQRGRGEKIASSKRTASPANRGSSAVQSSRSAAMYSSARSPRAMRC